MRPKALPAAFTGGKKKDAIAPVELQAMCPLKASSPQVGTNRNVMHNQCEVSATEQPNFGQWVSEWGLTSHLTDNGSFRSPHGATSAGTKFHYLLFRGKHVYRTCQSHYNLHDSEVETTASQLWVQCATVLLYHNDTRLDRAVQSSEFTEIYCSHKLRWKNYTVAEIKVDADLKYRKIMNPLQDSIHQKLKLNYSKIINFFSSNSNWR